MTAIRPGDLVLVPHGLRFRGRVIACSTGRAGVTLSKREGDGATPAGCHRIAQCFYRADRLPAPSPWAKPIGPQDRWCDASGDPRYNLHIRTGDVASYEALRRADPLYDIILTTDWNWPDAQAERGSAIFLHQWRRPGYSTAGCIAMARIDLWWLAGLVQPGTRLIVPGKAVGWPRKQQSAAATLV